MKWENLGIQQNNKSSVNFCISDDQEKKITKEFKLGTCSKTSESCVEMSLDRNQLNRLQN